MSYQPLLTKSKSDRSPNDFYATDPQAVHELLDSGKIRLGNNVFEPCAGMGHIADVLKGRGHTVYATDKYDYGYDYDKIMDFFELKRCYGDIFTNPPYKIANEFIRHAKKIMSDHSQLILLLRTMLCRG